MRNEQKPPMVVWLSELKMSWQVAEPKQGTLCQLGPYVHLDQFLEEVEREAQACADEGLDFDSSFVDILRDKVEEIIKNEK